MQENETEYDSCQVCDDSESSGISGKLTVESARDIWKSERAIKNWVGGVILGIGFIFLIFSSFNESVIIFRGEIFSISDLLFVLSMGVGGGTILRNGYISLKKRNLTISLLMSVAILSSIVVSVFGGRHLFLEGATLAFLFNFAELLEDYSIEKARGSLKELMDLSPDKAIVRRNGEKVEIPVEQVEKGEIVVIKPGDRIAVDGEIIEGNSSVNQAPVTGESIPVDKRVGDKVYAGTINEQGYLEIKSASTAAESTISKIVELVRGAERKRTEQEKFIEKFSSYYTPFVVLIAVAIILIPPLLLGSTWSTWFIRGITMLVLACPCAFVISTPVSVVSGITNAAKNGVLISGGNSLEAMGNVSVIAFDKTGTLTKGKLNVTDVIPLNGRTEEDVIKCACGVEERSDHPIARAIVNHVKKSHDISHEHGISEFEELSGKGVTANLEGKKHYAGKPSLIEELEFDLSHVHHSSDDERIRDEAEWMCEKGKCLNLLEETIPRLQREGKTVILVTAENKLEGIIAIADEIREEAKAVVSWFNSRGIKTVMLTGDNERAAKAISEEIGIKEYKAELLPEDKVNELKLFSEKYGVVAMVGDGINDAPALAAADVGIAMGVSGTDTAVETADIALLQDDLSKLPYLQRLSRKANRVIRSNIYASLGIKALLAIGVPLGYVSIALAVLAGDAGMTVGVTGNALRLSRLKP